MPDINLFTLQKIPGIHHPNAMRQHAENASAAYALVGAAGAHGVFPMDAVLSYAEANTSGISKKIFVKKNFTYALISMAVYTITGMLQNKTRCVPSYSEWELPDTSHDINSIAAMAKILQDLGKEVCINMQKAGFAELNQLDSDEYERCIRAVSQSNVNANAPQYMPPQEEETSLVGVRNNYDGGWHWLAQGSDSLFYDPCDGSIDNVWHPEYTHDVMNPYTFSGIWLVIH